MGTLVDHGGAEPKWNVNSFWHFESGEYNVLLFFCVFFRCRINNRVTAFR